MGELELIAAIERSLARRGEGVLVGPGDDASVTRLPGGGVSVTSVDTVVDGVHFKRSTHAAADVGHKALATSLSDLAAMGARAGEAYVALALAEDFDDDAARSLVAGAEALAERAGVTIAGGDVVASPVLAVSVTAVGYADDSEALVYRSGAQPGDLVGVSGRLGGATAGLALLDGVETPLEDEARERLIERHRRPEPRLTWGAELAAVGASAMIDVSDGVATDAGHLAARSGVALRVELQRLPRDEGVAEVAGALGRDPGELAAGGGDDYELLFCAAPELREEIEARLAGAVTWVGDVATGSGLTLVGPDGDAVALRGFAHR